MCKPRILVIDRATNIRRVVSQLLVEEGYEVLTADSTDDVQIDQFEPTVTVIDLESSDDLTLISAIPRQQLVAVVPFGCTPLALAAMSCGATAYIVKPLSRHELLVVIETAVKHAEIARELAELRRAARSLEEA